MTRRPTLTLLAAALALPLLTAATTAAPIAAPAADDAVGPPWISVEYPANPHHPDTRDALALIHTYHHGSARAAPMAGRAVGIVDGRTVTAPLSVERTYRPGVYAVRGELPSGAWVLAVDMTEGAEASALVALNGNREVTAVRIPGERRDGWVIPRTATSADVDALLRTSVALAEAGRHIRRAGD